LQKVDRQTAARLLNVGERSVARAHEVRDHGVPEIIHAVEQGEIAIPSGEMWLHEIKHDGFRVIARKDGDRVRLYSRPGNDLTGASFVSTTSQSALAERSAEWMLSIRSSSRNGFGR
jgi:ATP-dependent DNA ligase